MSKKPSVDNEQKKNEERNKLKLEQQQIVEDLRAVMSSPAGRRFVHSIVKHCGYYAGDICRGVDGRVDPYELAVQGGMRSVSLWLMSRCLEDCPGDWLHMYNEHISREANKQKE